MNNLALCESKSLREEQLKGLSQDRALETLDKAKALVMAVHQGTGIATTEQVAEYFEVSVETIQSIVKSNRIELQSDGLRLFKGKDLKEVLSVIDKSDNVPTLTIWTPRATLRCGMLLRDSEVAKQLRTTLLNVVETIPTDRQKLEQQMLPVPTLKELKEVNDLLKSAGFKQEYVERLTISNLKKHYPSTLSLLPESSDLSSLPTAKALFTPTQLAEQLGLFCKSNPKSGDARGVNKLLAELGYQTKVDGIWSATDKAINLNLCDRKPVETGSRTQKDQLMWSVDIVSILQEHVVKNP